MLSKWDLSLRISFLNASERGHHLLGPTAFGYHDNQCVGQIQSSEKTRNRVRIRIIHKMNLPFGITGS